MARRQPSVERLEEVHLEEMSRLRLVVWWIRRTVRDLVGRDVLDARDDSKKGRFVVRRIYKRADEFVSRYLPGLKASTPKKVAMAQVRDAIKELDYTVVDQDEEKPWGAYYRFASDQAERFIAEFFPGKNPADLRLGYDDIELSPKILLVAPGQRLSWQFHNRRAEVWRFLSPGAYYKSLTDTPGARHDAKAGHIVQFHQNERHRLCSKNDTSYTLVAEIWQHTNPTLPSDESDIIRLQDDYQR